MLGILGIVVFLLAGAVLAQADSPLPLPAVPPTPLELEQARAAMLEAQVRYFLGLLRTQETERQQSDLDAKVLASWWASYVAGLDAQLRSTVTAK